MIELVLRVTFSLFVVLFLMWALARVVRRPLGGRGNGSLTLLNRQQLSRGAAVTVVRVGDRAMILGVTDQQVSLLGEADVEEFEPDHRRKRESVPDDLPGPLDGSLLSPRTWTSTLDFLRDRTSRR